MNDLGNPFVCARGHRTERFFVEFEKDFFQRIISKDSFIVLGCGMG